MEIAEAAFCTDRVTQAVSLRRHLARAVKGLRSGRNVLICAWVRVPQVSFFFFASLPHEQTGEGLSGAYSSSYSKA